MSAQDVLMHNLRVVIEENQEKRLFLLRKLFEMSLGVPCLVAVTIFEEETRWHEHEVYEAARYLAEEGLLIIRDDDETLPHPRGPYLLLTHKGIVEVEQSITHPTRATEHFTATVINNYNASVGAVQTGPHSTAHAVQNLGAQAPEAFRITEALRRKIISLRPESEEAAAQLIEGLEDEFRLSRPRKARVQAFLKALGELTDEASVRKSLLALAKRYGVRL